MQSKDMYKPSVGTYFFWLTLTVIFFAVDAHKRPDRRVHGFSNDTRGASKYYHRYHPRLQHRSNLPNQEVLQSCTCSINNRERLCGSSSCPCRTYSAGKCMKIVCSCLKYGRCQPFYHSKNGYSCPCIGNFMGFNCSMVDHRPICGKKLLFEANESPEDQQLICFPHNGTNPISPCIDAEDDLVYTLAKGENSSASFRLRSKGNETCLWLKKGQKENVYTVTIVATEMDELYSRPERNDTFEVRVSVKKESWNSSTSFTKFTPTFLQFNFGNHPLEKGINFTLKPIDSDVNNKSKITYKLIGVSPKFFGQFVYLNSSSGKIIVQKPRNSTYTRQMVNIRVQAFNGSIILSTGINIRLNLIFSPPLCQVKESPVWLYSSAKYDYSPIANLHCAQISGYENITFQVQQNNSGVNFITKGTEILVSGTPPYQSGSYSLKLNIKDQLGDLGTINMIYVIAPAPDLQVRVINFSTAEVSWQFSTIQTIHAYKLSVSETQHSFSRHLTGSTKHQRLNNLQPLKNYSFQIRAEVGNHHIMVPSNILRITTPQNVSAVCQPMYNGSFLNSERTLRCGVVIMNCTDPGKSDTRDLVYRFSGSFTKLSVKNVTCLGGKCLFCFPKTSEGNFQLDVTVENQRMLVVYSLSIRLRKPKPPVCGSKTYFFTVSEWAQRDSIVGRIKVKNSSESDILLLTLLRPHRWLSNFYLSQNGDVHIGNPVNHLDNMDITLNILASNHIGHCTIVVVIHVIDENEPPTCNFPPVVYLMQPVTKGTRIVYLNCSDPDTVQENSQMSVSIQPNSRYATSMFEVDSANTIYAKRDIPFNLTDYNLEVKVQDAASTPGQNTYPLKLVINTTPIQKLTISFKLTKDLRTGNVSTYLNSDNYREFSKKFTDSVSTIFKQLKGFFQLEFVRIRPGTSIVDVDVMFYQQTLVSSIKAIYIAAIKNDGLSSFSVDPNYFQISTTNPTSLLIEKAQQMSPLVCVGCDVTYVCCSRPSNKNVSFHWSFNGISIDKYSDKMELVGLRKRCDSCPGQSQCLTLRPWTVSTNSTLSCEVSTPDQLIDSFDFNVQPERQPKVILNSSVHFPSTGVQESIVCSLIKPQVSFPVSFQWFLDSVPLNDKDVRFQVKNLSAFSQVLHIKQLKGFHHISCKACFVEGVPCSLSNVYFSMENESIIKMCDAYDQWKIPSQENCVDLSIWEIFSKLHKMKSLKTSTSKQVSLLLESLSKITAKEEPLKSYKSLQVGTWALNEIVEISKSSENKISNKEAMNFYHTASNLLSIKHKSNWDILQAKNNGVPKIMKFIGDFGNAIVNNLDKAADEPIFQTENIVVQIGQTRQKDIIFPKPDSGTNSLLGKSQVFLPEKTMESFLSANKTIGYSTVYYKNLAKLLTNKPNPSTFRNQTINSDVLAVTLATKLPVRLDPPVQLIFQHIQKNMTDPVCSFWDFYSNVSTMGSWSSRGCRTKYTNKTLTICACDHLTNFAVLMYPMKIDELHSRILSYITIVGCGFSILGCVLTLAAYGYLWRYIHRHRSIVLIHLCVSLIIADVIFLAGVEQTSSKVWCTSTAISLHYFYLVVFFLMLAEGIDMAISVIYVFATKSRISYLLLMAWGLPAIIVGITMASTSLKGYGNQRFCWLSLEDGMIWAFVAPALFVMAINFVVVILVFRAMFSTSRMLQKSAEEKAKSGLHGVCVLLPVLGLTWLFGVFSVNKQILTFQYFFALLNSIQGLLIFVFHCIVNKHIREAFWKRANHLSPNSGSSSRSSPRYFINESAKRLPSGVTPKNPKQGFEKTSKDQRDENATADLKSANQCYSLNVVLHCRVISDPKSHPQEQDLQSDLSAENTDSTKTLRKKRTE